MTRAGKWSDGGICLVLAIPAGVSEEKAGADDKKEIVFIADRCFEEEGAPPLESLGKLVLVTDIEDQDPWYEMVRVIVEAKKDAPLHHFQAGKVEEIAAIARKELPEFLWILTRPDRIDVNLHFDLLELLCALDEDPFIDCAFGYLTGANPKEAADFGRRLVKVQKETLPRHFVEFGPAADRKTQFSGPSAHALARDWKHSNFFHGPLEDLLKKKESLKGAGIVRAGGHGMPDRIDDSLTGEELRAHQIDFSPALYFSGPCYCGVTGAWYDVQSGAARRTVVDPMKSFALAVLESGASALFAGLDPDRGETCSQEIEHLWIHGDALGHASKETYDGVVVALRLNKLRLRRYEDGKRLDPDLVQTMICGGASRALFGDPTWRPFKAACPRPFEPKVRDRKDSLDLTWEGKSGPTKYWMANDVYRCDGGWTHRFAFREEIPLKTARELKSLQSCEVTADGKPIEARFRTAMIERWGGKAFLHVYLVFPPAGQQNVYFVEKDLEARLTFKK